MKKWYAITAILALAFIISMATCTNYATDVDRYSDELVDVELELDGIKQELAASKIELRVAEKDASDAKAELESVQVELSQLTATKEIDFDNGLRIFEIERAGSYVRGKIQNISDTPIDKVVVIVTFYYEDGKLSSVEQSTITDLFPQEVAEWNEYLSYGGGPSFDVYAIGDKTT